MHDLLSFVNEFSRVAAQSFIFDKLLFHHTLLGTKVVQFLPNYFQSTSELYLNFSNSDSFINFFFVALFITFSNSTHVVPIPA